jgi:hypothetical protein
MSGIKSFLQAVKTSAINLLLKMQDDHYHMVRVRVAEGLRKVKTKEAQAALRRLLRTELKRSEKPHNIACISSFPGVSCHKTRFQGVLNNECYFR